MKLIHSRTFVRAVRRARFLVPIVAASLFVACGPAFAGPPQPDRFQGAGAESGQEPKPKKSTAATPARKSEPWKAIKDPKGEYRALVPIKPERLEQKLRSPNGIDIIVTVHRAVHEQRIIYLLAHHDLIEAPEGEIRINETLEGGIRGAVSQVLGTVKSHRKITLSKKIAPVADGSSESTNESSGVESEPNENENSQQSGQPDTPPAEPTNPSPGNPPTGNVADSKKTATGSQTDSEISAPTEGFPGREFEYEGKRGRLKINAVSRIYVVRNRVYQLTVLGINGEYDKAAARKFMNSFRVSTAKTKATDEESSGTPNADDDTPSDAASPGGDGQNRPLP